MDAQYGVFNPTGQAREMRAVELGRLEEDEWERTKTARGGDPGGELEKKFGFFQGLRACQEALDWFLGSGAASEPRIVASRMISHHHEQSLVHGYRIYS